jgi:hypothetical protein
VKKGAGALMVAWGLDRCEEQQVLAYLESTMEAVRFYKRLGFTAAAQLSRDIKAQADKGLATLEKYRAVGMIYWPRGKPVEA